MSKVAVHVDFEIPFPQVLLAAARFGADIAVTDISRTAKHRVVYVEEDVARKLADRIESLVFVPDLTPLLPKPEPQPQADPESESKPVVDVDADLGDPVGKKTTKRAEKKTTPHTDAPEKKTARKKTKTTKKTTATKSKTRGSNGGES